jgi:uncharacterized membrane protein
MYCSNCGLKLSKTTKFCSKCGTTTSEEKPHSEIADEDLKKQNLLKHAYQNAAEIIYVIVGFTLVAYLVFYFLKIDLLGQEKNLIIGGLIFLVLGFLVQKKLMIALIIAIAIYGWDTFSGLVQLFQGNFLAIGFLFVHIIFLSAMIKSVGSIWTLKQKLKG